MRGPMRMEHFLGMKFWRWRLSLIWRAELMGTARASMWIERQVVRKYIWLLAGTKVSWVKPTALSESTTPGWCPHFSISFRQEQGDRFFLSWSLYWLKRLFRERLGLLCKGLASYMKAEQDMFVILGKCQKEVIRWENFPKLPKLDASKAKYHWQSWL